MRKGGFVPLFSSSQNNPYLIDPDVALMLAFQKGDKAAFEKLMGKHYKRVFNIAYRFLSNREAADDLAQEVFLKVYKAASSYKPQAKFQTWLYQITKNVCLNELRKHRGQTVSLDETFAGDEGELTRQIADRHAVNPLENLEAQDIALIVKEAIETLPDNQRMAVILRRFENLSYEDIAKTMDCSLEAVKSLLSRAKENLKKKLAHLSDLKNAQS